MCTKEWDRPHYFLFNRPFRICYPVSAVSPFRYAPVGRKLLFANSDRIFSFVINQFSHSVSFGCNSFRRRSTFRAGRRIWRKKSRLMPVASSYLKTFFENRRNSEIISRTISFYYVIVDATSWATTTLTKRRRSIRSNCFNLNVSSDLKEGNST